MNRIYGILLVALILLLLPMSAEAYTIMKTGKTTYNKGEIVKFTLYNYNSYPIEIDNKPSILTETGECVYGCVYAMFYDPITIPAWGKYSWNWDQKNSNGNQVSSGKYKGYLGGYYSNIFTIKESSTGGGGGGCWQYCPPGYACITVCM